jgi:hypothetical protein
MITDWTAFDEQTERDAGMWRTSLHLWQLEVISARCTWQLWPSDATRSAYVRAIAERERCEATVRVLSELVSRTPRTDHRPD